MFLYVTACLLLAAPVGQGGGLLDVLLQALLSLPYIGFLEKDDPTYIKTKETLLSRKNPYFAAGEGFTGVGYVLCPCVFASLRLLFRAAG